MDHPLLAALAHIVQLAPRGRRLLRHLLTEIDDDEPARCRAKAAADSSSAPPTAAEPSSVIQGDGGQRRDPGRPRAKAAATPSAATASDWPPLRDEIKAAITARGLTRREAAVEGGFNTGTFARWMSRTARPPGRAAQEQLRAWVDKGMPSRHPPAPPEAGLCPAQSPLPAIDPPAAEPAPNGQDGNGVAPSASEPRLSRRGEVLPAYKLSQDQRDRLGLILQHDRGSLRGKVTIEIAEQAAAGQRLNPAIIARLIEVVDPPQHAS